MIATHDVNFGTAVLHVPFTKTDKARTIPLTDRAVDILRERKAASASDAEYAFLSVRTHSGWHGNGASVAPRTPGALVYRSFAFMIYGTKPLAGFFEKGLNTAELASISGHRDLRTLFRYTHLRPEDLVKKLRIGKALAA